MANHIRVYNIGMGENNANGDIAGLQLLKCCDDIAPFRLVPQFKDDSKTAYCWKLCTTNGHHKSSWLDNGTCVDRSTIRARVEPWLSALFQSEHLNLLVGSGFPCAVYQIANSGREAANIMAPAEIACKFTAQICAEARRAAEAMNRGNHNIEDVFRAAYELLRGLEILYESKGNSSNEQKHLTELREQISKAQHDLIGKILLEESSIITDQSSGEHGCRESAVKYLVGFLMRFASRTGTRERLHLFTTNYDRCIEIGADLAGMRLLDRFVGTLSPVFRSSRLDIDIHYNPPGIRGEPRYLEGVARFTKLHGSLDWVFQNGVIRRISLPYGAESIQPYLQKFEKGISAASPVMIYPNSAKDWETAFYPYVELFRDFAAAVCRPNTTLFCYGYGFGDEHINRIIFDMMTIPSTHLVVISRGLSSSKMDLLLKYSSQVTLLIGNHLGNLVELYDNYLPFPATNDAMTDMGDIVRSRLGSKSREKNLKRFGAGT